MVALNQTYFVHFKVSYRICATFEDMLAFNQLNEKFSTCCGLDIQAVEFRNRDWFVGEQYAATCEWLKANNMALVAAVSSLTPSFGSELVEHCHAQFKLG